jgi:hypothetical protein
MEDTAMECRVKVYLPSHIREALSLLAQQEGLTFEEYARLVLMTHVQVEEANGRVPGPRPVQPGHHVVRRPRALAAPRTGSSGSWGSSI